MTPQNESDMLMALRASIARVKPGIHIIHEPCARCRALEGRARPAVCSACRLSEADRALMSRALAAGEALAGCAAADNEDGR